VTVSFPVRKGYRPGLDPTITTGEMHDRFPDFTAGAAALADLREEAPDPDPGLADALLAAAGPSRVLRARDAARIAATYYAPALDALERVAVALKGEPPDPRPPDWLLDVPTRLKQHMKARALSRADIDIGRGAAHLEGVRAERARVADDARDHVDRILASWVPLCDELHALMSRLGDDR
jgi:hypothetical protein